MNFIIGYAGIPSEIFNEIGAKDRLNIAGTNVEFVSRALRPKGEVASYTESDANYFIKEFSNRLAQDHENKLRDTGFAIIYISHEGPTTEKFREFFFPAVYTAPIEWKLDSGTKASARQSIKDLINSLRVATNEAKSSIRAIKKEVTEADGRTPLLLPVRNFRSKWLVSELFALQASLALDEDKTTLLKKSINRIVHYHPRKQPEDPRYKRLCFVDEKRVEFNPPGQDRHGYPRAGHPHTDRCIVAGRRRLGAPYDHAFHYDCIKSEGGNLSGDFWGCHSSQAKREGDPHLNISPNDFVR